MRSQEEILHYLQHENDVFGFVEHVLAPYLTYENATPYRKLNVTAAQWEEAQAQAIAAAGVTTMGEVTLQDLKRYLPFAFTCVLDHKMVAAHRSIETMIVWLWLLGDEELCEFARDADNYVPLGAPVLGAIAAKYDVPIPDNPHLHNMIARQACQPRCAKGCPQKQPRGNKA